jgi:hypothetical protein
MPRDVFQNPRRRYFRYFRYSGGGLPVSPVYRWRRGRPVPGLQKEAPTAILISRRC